MVEQRYQAVISEGLSVSQVAEKVGVSRQTLHAWLARYEAQGLNEWVDYYNNRRPHQCLDMTTPAERFAADAMCKPASVPGTLPQDRTGDDWVSRRVTTNRVVSVAWQQICLGAHHAGARCFIGGDLVKTIARTNHGEVRNKQASRTREQA